MRAAAETLSRAAALMVEKGWTQRECARDATGKSIHSSDPRAVAFCIVGAVCRVGKPGVGAVHPAFGFIEQVIDRTAVAGWNDEVERTASEVIAALDAAYVVALQTAGIEPEDVL